MLSARELGLNVRPHVLEITQTFYNSSVGFTYVSTDIIHKNIYMLLQDVQHLV